MTKFTQSLILLILPLLVFHWITFGDKRIGGFDYDYIGVAQYETQFALKKKTFPLYLPGLCGGASSFAEPRTQMFHPITTIAAHTPGYWSGGALHITTLLKILSLGLTHIVIFFFLKSLKLDTLFSFILSFITIYNLKMLNILHFFTVEAYTGHLLLAASTMWYYTKPTKFLGPLSVIASVYLLIQSGHPPYSYLALLGNIFLILITPFYISHILPEIQPTLSSNLKYYKKIFFCLTIGLLLCSAYIVPYYFDFLLDNSHRVGMSFKKALAFQDTITGSLSNIFNPFFGSTLGNFGGSSVVLISIFLPALFFWKSIPRPIFLIWLIFFFTFILSTGNNTNLYYLFWKYFPVANTFRVPGRVTTIFPLLFLLLLIWLVKASPLQTTIFKKKLEMPLYVPLAIISLIVCTIYNNPIILPKNLISSYSPARLYQIPDALIILLHVMGALILIFVALYGLLQNYRKELAGILAILIVIQITIFFSCDTLMKPKFKDWSTLQQVENMKKNNLSFIINTKSYWKWHFATKLVSFHVETKKAPLENRLARITKNYIGVPSQEEVYKNLKLARAKDHVLIEGLDPKYSKLTPTLTKVDQVFLDYSSYNKVIFKVINQSPGFFVFSFPYSKHWEAYVNSKRSKILKANGIEQAVWIPKGNHTIEFRYWSPAAFWGMLISHLVTFAIIVFSLFAIKNRTTRIILSIITFIVLSFFFSAWYKSLYHGINLETKYLWSTPN